MTNAGMTVKVNYNYNEENYCLFVSNGDGTYTFDSGYGWVGGDNDRAKALVVEGGKLVFKQNFYDTIDENWDTYGFSVIFDTSNNTYIQWAVETPNDIYASYFISVEVNGTTITVDEQSKITVDDLDKEEGQSWSDIISNNSDLIYEDDGIVRRCSDNARLMKDESGEFSWEVVQASEQYSSFNSYKFDGDL